MITTQASRPKLEVIVLLSWEDRKTEDDVIAQ